MTTKRKRNHHQPKTATIAATVGTKGKSISAQKAKFEHLENERILSSLILEIDQSIDKLDKLLQVECELDTIMSNRDSIPSNPSVAPGIDWDETLEVHIRNQLAYWNALIKKKGNQKKGNHVSYESVFLFLNSDTVAHYHRLSVSGSVDNHLTAALYTMVEFSLRALLQIYRDNCQNDKSRKIFLLLFNRYSSFALCYCSSRIQLFAKQAMNRIEYIEVLVAEIEYIHSNIIIPALDFLARDLSTDVSGKYKSLHLVMIKSFCHSCLQILELVKGLPKTCSKKVKSVIHETLVHSYNQGCLDHHEAVCKFLLIKLVDGSLSENAELITFWVFEMHQIEPKLPFPFLQALVSHLCANSTDSNKYLEEALTLLRDVCSKLPRVIACFLAPLIVFSEHSRAHIRKMYIDIMGVCLSKLTEVTREDINLCIRVFLNAMNDRDAHVRIKAIKLLSSVGYNCPWTGDSGDLFLQCFDCVIHSLQDKAKSVRVEAIKGIRELISHNPFTRNLDQRIIYQSLQAAENCLKEYEECRTILDQELGCEKADSIIAHLWKSIMASECPSRWSEINSLEGVLLMKKYVDLDEDIINFKDHISIIDSIVATKGKGFLLNSTFQSLHSIRDQMLLASSFLNRIYDEVLPIIYENLADSSNRCKEFVFASQSLLIGEDDGQICPVIVTMDINWSKLIASCTTPKFVKGCEMRQQYHNMLVDLVTNVFLRKIVPTTEAAGINTEALLQALSSNISSWHLHAQYDSWQIILNNIRENHPVVDLSSVISQLLEKLESQTNVLPTLRGIEIFAEMYASTVRVNVHYLIERLPRSLNHVDALSERIQEEIAHILNIMCKCYNGEACLLTSFVHSFLDANILPLLNIFRRETINLIYKTPNPPSIIYPAMAELENRVIRTPTTTTMANFLLIIGDVVSNQAEIWEREANKKWLALNTTYEKSSPSTDDESSDMVTVEEESADYMADTLARQNQNQFKDQFVHEMLTTSFLSRYIQLLKSIIESYKVSTVVKRCAVICMGKYMVLSQKIATELLDTVVESSENEDYSLRCNILVIVAHMQSIIPVAAEQYLPLLFGALNDNCFTVRKNALLLLGNLFLRRIIKNENQLHYIAMCMTDDDELKDYALTIISAVLYSEIKRVPRILFNIFLCLTSGEYNDGSPFCESRYAHAIKELIDIIFSDSVFNAQTQKKTLNLFVKAFIDQPSNEIAFTLSVMNPLVDSWFDSLSEYICSNANQMFTQLQNQNESSPHIVHDLLEAFLKKVRKQGQATPNAVKSQVDSLIEVLHNSHASVVEMKKTVEEVGVKSLKRGTKRLKTIFADNISYHEDSNESLLEYDEDDEFSGLSMMDNILAKQIAQFKHLHNE